MGKKLIVASLILAFLVCTCNPKGSNKKTSGVDTAGRDQIDLKYNMNKIKVPAGFQISVFAEIPNARSMCLGTNGTLFIGNMGGGAVYAAIDSNKDGRADKVFTIVSGLNTPCGVAFKNGSLYVAEISRILRFDSIETKLNAPPAYKVVYDKLPDDKMHGWKFIAFGPDGKLYVPVGAPCNICIPDSIHACITRMNPDGTGFEVFARGIRNTVGFTWEPGTHNLWFTDNGRDNLGEDIPNDELNIATKMGMNFGYPFCHQGDIPDPEYGKNKNCADFTPPVLKLGAHVAPLGLRFNTGNMFPTDFKGALFIAQHGSWNRKNPDGYRVMFLKVKNGKPTEYEPFATGWLEENGKVIGRPADVEIAPDGALLVSDDLMGAVYRISYNK